MVLVAARLPTRSHCGAEEGLQRVTDEGCLHVTADGFFQDEWGCCIFFSKCYAVFLRACEEIHK